MSGKGGFRSLKLSTISHIAIILFISVLALIHLKSVIQPFVVAVLLFLLIRPAAKWFEQRYGHPIAAYGMLVFTVVVVLFFVSILLYANMQAFTDEVPELNTKLHERIAWLESITLFGYSFDTSAITDQITVGAIESFASGLLGSLASFTVFALTALIFLLFIILEAETLPGRLKAAYPAEMKRMLGIAANSGEGINTYVITRATVALGQAVSCGALLYLFGIPGWFLWACITFLMDFIPYIGGLIATVPPILLGFIVLEPMSALFLLAILIANQQLWGGIIEPQLSGQRLNISPIVLLLVVAFWGWAWGLMGMVLGVPLAVIMKIVLESDPRTKPIALLLSSNPQSSEEE
jgi:AI-2 transport protein TqsA